MTCRAMRGADDDVDLHLHGTAGKNRADGRARRVGLREVLRIDLVERREIGEVGEVGIHLHHVGHGSRRPPRQSPSRSAGTAPPGPGNPAALLPLTGPSASGRQRTGAGPRSRCPGNTARSGQGPLQLELLLLHRLLSCWSMSDAVSLAGSSWKPASNAVFAAAAFAEALLADAGKEPGHLRRLPGRIGGDERRQDGEGVASSSACRRAPAPSG